MSLLMNILWLVLGGVVTAVEYIVASVGMMVTIIGIPFGIQTLKIGLLPSALLASVLKRLLNPADA